MQTHGNDVTRIWYDCTYDGIDGSFEEAAAAAAATIPAATILFPHLAHAILQVLQLLQQPRCLCTHVCV